uniref:Orcokinin n=1 Tax=Syphacia muris TaxID=451379 RepID=A0A0N5ATU2_9BILA
MSLLGSFVSFVLVLCAVIKDVSTLEDDGTFVEHVDLNKSSSDFSLSLKDYPLTNVYLPRKRYYRRSLFNSPFLRHYQNYQNGYGLPSESMSTSYSSSSSSIQKKYNRFGSYGISSLASVAQPAVNKNSFYGYGTNNQGDSFMPYASSNNIGNGAVNSNVGNSGLYSTDYSATSSGLYNPSPYDTDAFSGLSQIFYPSMNSGLGLKTGRSFRGSNNLYGASSAGISSYQSLVPSFLGTNEAFYESSLLPLFGSSASRRGKVFRPNRYGYDSAFSTASDKSLPRLIVDNYANRPSIKPN